MNVYEANVAIYIERKLSESVKGKNETDWNLFDIEAFLKY